MSRLAFGPDDCWRSRIARSHAQINALYIDVYNLLPFRSGHLCDRQEWVTTPVPSCNRFPRLDLLLLIPSGPLTKSFQFLHLKVAYAPAHRVFSMYRHVSTFLHEKRCRQPQGTQSSGMQQRVKLISRHRCISALPGSSREERGTPPHLKPNGKSMPSFRMLKRQKGQG